MQRPAGKKRQQHKQPHNQRALGEYWNIEVVDDTPRGPTQTTLPMWSRILSSRSQEPPRTSNCVIVDGTESISDTDPLEFLSLSAPQPATTQTSSKAIVLDDDDDDDGDDKAEVVELSDSQGADSDVLEVQPPKRKRKEETPVVTPKRARRRRNTLESSPVLLHASSPTVRRFNESRTRSQAAALADCTQPLSDDSVPGSPIPADRLYDGAGRSRSPLMAAVAATVLPVPPEIIPETPQQSPKESPKELPVESPAKPYLESPELPEFPELTVAHPALVELTELQNDPISEFNSSPVLPSLLPHLSQESQSDPIRSEENSLEQHTNSEDDPLSSITQWYHDNQHESDEHAEEQNDLHPATEDRSDKEERQQVEMADDGYSSPLEGFCDLKNSALMDDEERDLYYNQFQPTRSHTAPHVRPQRLRQRQPAAPMAVQPRPYTSAAATMRGWAGNGGRRPTVSRSAPGRRLGAIRPVGVAPNNSPSTQRSQQASDGFTVCNHYADDPFLDIEASLNWEGGGSSRFG